jgi:hypothetical protein
MRLASDADVEQPMRPGQNLHGLGQGCTTQHAALGIAVAHAGHGQVDSEQQRVTTCRGSPLQQGFHYAAIPQHVELKPARIRHGRIHFLDRTDADR